MIPVPFPKLSSFSSFCFINTDIQSKQGFLTRIPICSLGTTILKILEVLYLSKHSFKTSLRAKITSTTYETKPATSACTKDLNFSTHTRGDLSIRHTTKYQLRDAFKHDAVRLTSLSSHAVHLISSSMDTKIRKCCVVTSV